METRMRCASGSLTPPSPLASCATWAMDALVSSGALTPAAAAVGMTSAACITSVAAVARAGAGAGGGIGAGGGAGDGAGGGAGGGDGAGASPSEGCWAAGTGAGAALDVLPRFFLPTAACGTSVAPALDGCDDSTGEHGCSAAPGRDVGGATRGWDGRAFEGRGSEGAAVVACRRRGCDLSLLEEDAAPPARALTFSARRV
mmetsp:Transcript_58865/g.116948  ORF Transcript_58865/g.116948 Transcript_58865/m.116948 type:complete len:201 (-) Transcript_58865:761-1363(-)